MALKILIFVATIHLLLQCGEATNADILPLSLGMATAIGELLYGFDVFSPDLPPVINVSLNIGKNEHLINEFGLGDYMNDEGSCPVDGCEVNDVTNGAGLSNDTDIGHDTDHEETFNPSGANDTVFNDKINCETGAGRNNTCRPRKTIRNTSAIIIVALLFGLLLAAVLIFLAVKFIKPILQSGTYRLPPPADMECATKEL